MQAEARAHSGLDAQRAAIAAECDEHGWTLLEVIEDGGYSAKDLKRPGVRMALDALERGDADALVVSKLDRLSRSMLDFASIMHAAQRHAWGLVALDVNVDTTSPAGEAMANVLATFAQFERRLIGQRTRDALAVKREQGVTLGRPRSLPMTWWPEWCEREAGRSLRAIAQGLNADAVPTAQGGKSWHASTVSAVLRSADSPLSAAAAARSDCR